LLKKEEIVKPKEEIIIQKKEDKPIKKKRIIKSNISRSIIK
jgi:hypothetical protein